jgi:hypothetical protein
MRHESSASSLVGGIGSPLPVTRSLLVLAVMCIASFAGCDTPHNFSHVQFVSTPTAHVVSDPGANLSDLKTFSLCPMQKETAGGAEVSLMKRQVLYLLGAWLEGRGLSPVIAPARPDVVVVASASNEFKSWYVPPSSVTVPQYIPGEIIRSYGTFYGTSNYGQTLMGNSTATTYLPGYWTASTWTLPGYVEGCYFPAISIQLCDPAENFNAIWTGSSVGATRDPRFGIAVPWVVASLGPNLPKNARRLAELYSGPGYINLIYLILSRDGSSFVPVVWDTAHGSSARKAGLRRWDIIAEIDGKSTVNRTARELLKLDEGALGSTAVLTIVRLNKVFKASVVREQIPSDWKQALIVS